MFRFNASTFFRLRYSESCLLLDIDKLISHSFEEVKMKL